MDEGKRNRLENRYLEMRFVHFVQKLFKDFYYNNTLISLVYDMITLTDADPDVLLDLVKDVRQHISPLLFDRYEAWYVARQLGKSYRQAGREIGFSRSEQSRTLKKLIEEDVNLDLRFRNLAPRATEEQLYAIKKILLVLQIIKEL